jgi:hypothetical protein
MAEFIAEFMAEFIAEFMAKFIAEFMAEFIAEFMAEFIAEFMAEFIAEFTVEASFLSPVWGLSPKLQPATVHTATRTSGPRLTLKPCLTALAVFKSAPSFSRGDHAVGSL